MKLDFESFINTLSETNAQLGFFVDFDKARANTKKIEIKLNQLNYLLGKEDLNKAVEDLHAENPSVFDILEILIAIRPERNVKCIDKNRKLVRIKDYLGSVEGIIEFIDETGLSEVFRNKDITNLVDYVFGIEVGLDTHARKNRGGKVMEKIVEDLFKTNNIPFEDEVFVEIEALGVDKKRYDFVVRTKQKTYLIEVNYYSGGGSKLNETARSYSELATNINNKDFEFVWITDGFGWKLARNKLEEAYSKIPHVYNLHTFDRFVEKLRSEGFD